MHLDVQAEGVKVGGETTGTEEFEDPFGNDDDDAGTSVGDGRVPGVDTDVDEDEDDTIRPTQRRGASGAAPPLDDEGRSLDLILCRALM